MSCPRGRARYPHFDRSAGRVPADLRQSWLLERRGRRLPANARSPGFPAPLLTLSESSAPEGKMVTVTCAAGAGALVTLDGVPAAVPGQPSQLQVNATENDDRRSFFCDATLEVDGETLNKNESAELRVLCEFTSCLPPRALQGSVWSQVESFPQSTCSLSESHTSVHRCPPTGRFGLSQKLDMARGPRADTAL